MPIRHIEVCHSERSEESLSGPVESRSFAALRMTSPKMTPYEQKALKQIRAWQAAPPGWGARLLAKPGSKLAQVVQELVPTGVLRAALTGADRLGRKWSDERSILQRAGV